MNLKAEYNDTWREWHVIDADTYDGAEDSHGSCQVIGRGATEPDAVLDWFEQQEAFTPPAEREREEREYAAECELDRRRDDAKTEGNT